MIKRNDPDNAAGFETRLTPTQRRLRSRYLAAVLRMAAEAGHQPGTFQKLRQASKKVVAECGDVMLFTSPNQSDYSELTSAHLRIDLGDAHVEALRSMFCIDVKDMARALEAA